MRTSLSARGFELTRNVMRLNETLAELANDHVFLGESLYFITIMASRPRRSRGAGSSMAITRSSTTSSWATRWS
jgi:hypothetical protein